MSLIHFHRFLISAGILFCAGFGIWQFFAFPGEGLAWSVMFGGVFLALAAGLTYYLFNLKRFLGYEDEPR